LKLYFIIYFILYFIVYFSVLPKRMKTIQLLIQPLRETITFHIGQNKEDNFLVIDISNPNDIWFHINNISSCHIVASMPENVAKKDKKYIVKAGAMLCKKYTNKAKGETNVEIVYTEIKNVVKTETIGCVHLLERKTIKI